MIDERGYYIIYETGISTYASPLCNTMKYAVMKLLDHSIMQSNRDTHMDCKYLKVRV